MSAFTLHDTYESNSLKNDIFSGFIISTLACASLHKLHCSESDTYPYNLCGMHTIPVHHPYSLEQCLHNQRNVWDIYECVVPDGPRHDHIALRNDGIMLHELAVLDAYFVNTIYADNLDLGKTVICFTRSRNVAEAPTIANASTTSMIPPHCPFESFLFRIITVFIPVNRTIEPRNI